MCGIRLNRGLKAKRNEEKWKWLKYVQCTVIQRFMIQWKNARVFERKRKWGRSRRGMWMRKWQKNDYITFYTIWNYEVHVACSSSPYTHYTHCDNAILYSAFSIRRSRICLCMVFIQYSVACVDIEYATDLIDLNWYETALSSEEMLIWYPQPNTNMAQRCLIIAFVNGALWTPLCVFHSMLFHHDFIFSDRLQHKKKYNIFQMEWLISIKDYVYEAYHRARCCWQNENEVLYLWTSSCCI